MTKSQEMKAKLEVLKNECQTFLNDGKVSDAKTKMAEIDELKDSIAIQERLEAEEKLDIANSATGKEQQKRARDSIKEFADAFRHGFKNSVMTSGSDPDGGYTVPEDISTQVKQYRETFFDFSHYVTTESVSTNKGKRTYQKKSAVTGFAELDELGAISELETPQFERVSYNIKNYGGFIPLSNLLKNDSDANIVAVIMKWFGRNSAVTRNNLILNIVKAKSQTAIADLKGLKKELNVTLGQTYKPTSSIFVNDDGLNYLDTLEDSNGRPLLNPDPTAPSNLRLRVGANVVPIVTVPNQFLPTVENKAPIIIGDLKEAITLFDRQLLSITQSDTASAGSYNAFEQNCTLIRGIEREDVVQVDPDAFVYGGIDISAGA